MKPVVLIVLFSCIFFKSYGQFSNYAFGDVTREELLIRDCAFEPGVPAMVIAERCELANDLEAPYHAITIRRRIKILTKEGLSYGNFELEYLDRYSEIVFFRASVYNLENDRVIEEKTKSFSASLTNIDKKHIKYSVPLPNVRVGSIIDIFYKQHDNNGIPIQPWYFQSEIPCGWSEYVPQIQKKASYNYHFTGILPFAVNTIQDPSQGSKTKGGFLINRFAVANAPSCHLNEPFLLRPQEQISKVELVFDSYNENSIWGNSSKAKTWNEISASLLKNSGMGKVIDDGDFLINPLKEILVSCSNYEDSLSKVYEYIRQTVKCNGYRDIYARNLQKTLAEKSGNSGEINLLLIAALREAGFDCHPVLLPTNERTPSSRTDPGSNGINYLVAAIFKDTSCYLLDASKREIAFNTLPLKCLNGDGFLVSDHEHPKWLPLLRNERFETQTRLSYEWSPEKVVTAFVEKSSYSLSANRLRHMNLEEGEAEYIKSRQLDYPGLNMTAPRYTGLNETSLPFVEKFALTLKAVDYNTPDSYYLQTVPVEAYKENPFKGNKRDFTIDFLAPTIENFDETIKIPVGFKIAAIPESITISRLNDDLLFAFSVKASADGREISVHSGIQIRKSSFSKDKYEDIRQFYAEIVEHQNTFVELKKE